MQPNIIKIMKLRFNFQNGWLSEQKFRKIGVSFNCRVDCYRGLPPDKLINWEQIT